MASGVGFIVGLALAGVILLASLVAAIFVSPRVGAVGYATTIYVMFGIMAVSSWCTQVNKNNATWEIILSKLERYILYRHRTFFYYPFAAANFAHFCNWARIFAVLWAIFCASMRWYVLSAALAFFYILSTPMITIWSPISNYQKCVQRGHQWAQERLNAMQHILDLRDALGF